MYNKCYISEHQGNPLIEALPPLVDDDKVILKLRSTQVCVASERETPAFIRKKYLHRMEQFVEPTYQYLECFRMIEDLIIQSYVPKNPFTNTTQHWLHHDRPEESIHTPSQGRFVSRAAAMAVVGDGGAGKSWMLESILGSYDQIIRHNSYNGEMFNLDQIVWIKVNCTENANVKAMLILILEELDRLTGSNDAQKISSARDAVAQASLAITRKMKSIFLGVLVIDEMQHLQFANAKLKELFIQFILNTLGRAGVPIVFAGDPRITEFLTSGLPVSRRIETGGVIVMRGYDGHEWDLFAEQLWMYQWSNPRTPLSEELSSYLYDLSTGLPDYAVRIFKAAQKLVIGSDDEIISLAVLRQAYEETCMLSDENLSKRRKTNKSQSKKQLNHTSFDDSVPQLEEKNDGSIDHLKPKVASKKIHDVNRIQHDEFKGGIQALKNRAFIPPSNIAIDTIRSAASHKDPIKSLLDSKILFRQSILKTG